MIRIDQSYPYYASSKTVSDNFNAQTGLSFIDDGVSRMKLVNEQFRNMSYNTWYLLPQAYSLTLKKIYP